MTFHLELARVSGPDLTVIPYNVGITTLTTMLGSTLLAFGVSPWGNGTAYVTYNSAELVSGWQALSSTNNYYAITERAAVNELTGNYHVGAIRGGPAVGEVTAVLDTFIFKVQDGVALLVGTGTPVSVPAVTPGAELRLDYFGPDRNVLWEYAGDDIRLTHVYFIDGEYSLGTKRTVSWYDFLRPSFTFADAFGRIDGTPLASPWTVSGGTWITSGNRLSCAAPTSTFAFATVDAGEAYHAIVQATMAVQVGCTPGVVLRYVDSSNYVRVHINYSGATPVNYVIIQVIGGSASFRGQTSGVTPADGQVLRVVLAGQWLDVYVDGVHRGAASLSTPFTVGTRHGLMVYDTPAAQIDDVSVTTKPDGVLFDQRMASWAGSDFLAVGGFWDGYPNSGTVGLILKKSGDDWVPTGKFAEVDFIDNERVSDVEPGGDIAELALFGPEGQQRLACIVERAEELYVRRPDVDYYYTSPTSQSPLPGTPAGGVYFIDPDMSDPFIDFVGCNVLFRYNEDDGSHYRLDYAGLHFVDGGGVSTMVQAFANSAPSYSLGMISEGTTLIVYKYVPSPYSYESYDVFNQTQNYGKTIVGVFNVASTYEIYVSDGLDYGDSVGVRTVLLDGDGAAALGPYLDASAPKGLDINMHGPATGVDSAGNWHITYGENDPFGNNQYHDFWDMILLGDGSVVEKVKLDQHVDENWYYADQRSSQHLGWPSGSDLVFVTGLNVFDVPLDDDDEFTNTDLLLIALTESRLNFDPGPARVRFTQGPKIG